MKSRIWLWSIAIYLFATLAITSQLTAQTTPQHQTRHQQYRLYDVGTFGGPNSAGSFDAISLTTAGAIGIADTAVPDPFNPYCFLNDCVVGHAFLWRNGVTTDLGALPGNNGGNSAYAFAINQSGLVVGISENGATDPVTGFPSTSPVAWLNGQIFNLGNFGGTQGGAGMVNDRGQIVGAATNSTYDEFSLYDQFLEYFPATTQLRAFLWEHGMKRDLGTLGGPDAEALYINQAGQVAGRSYINSTPNPDTGIPTLDPFLWDGRRMIDLGSLGGTLGGPEGMNNKGQVVGYSDVAGDQAWHGFLWHRGVLTDLLPFAGMTHSNADWINEAGIIVGTSFRVLPELAGSAVLWNQGRITNLGTLPSDTHAYATFINNAQQVVGVSCVLCDSYYTGRAFLWENGDMVDLNALVQPSSDMVVAYPYQIDDRGEIVAGAMLPSGDVHAVVLVPDGDCDSSCEQRIADSQNNPRVVRPANRGTMTPQFGKSANRLHNPSAQRPGIAGPLAVPWK